MEIIIKPTEACNGTCVYCSADGTLGKVKILPRERLGRLFEIFAEWLRGGQRRGLRFLWHGGEPMLCGPDYYAEVMREQRRVFGEDIRQIRNAMQSNLSLVDQHWVPLLKDLLKDQAIGTSFDIVDGVRGLAGGKDLSEVWVRAVNLLRREGIRVGVVYVAHRKSLDRADDIYRFFRNIGLHVRVNPLYREGRADSGQSQPLWITAEEYGRFLVDLCGIWRADRMRCSIMPLMEWYRAWKGSSRLCCDSRGVCHTSHLGINPDGAVFGCGRQSDHRANLLGNIFDDSLDEILRRREQGALAGRSSGLREGFCRDCRFWELCHGGCPMMGLLYHGDMLREEYFCGARKRVYEHFEKLFGPPVLSSQRSAVSDQRSAIGNQRSAISDQQSATSSQQSAVSGQPENSNLPPLPRGGRGGGPAGCPTSSGGGGATIASTSASDARQRPRNHRERGVASRPSSLNPEPRTLNPTPRFAVAIEQPEGWPIADAVRIVTSQPDLDRLTAGRVEPGERIRIFVGEERFAASPAEYTPFGGRLTVVTEAGDAAQSPVLLDDLRKHGAELMFSAATIGDGSAAREAAEAGVPVRLEFSTDHDEAVLSGLLDHFLHSTTLQVPIEPFYSLAASMGQRRRLTLWQVFDSTPGRCLFVDAACRVSLSKWWAQRGVFLGTSSDNPAAWHESDLWKELVAFADRVFISQTPCAFCEHYPYCGGIWRAASDSGTPCLIWQRLMDRMVEAYRSCPTVL